MAKRSIKGRSPLLKGGRVGFKKGGGYSIKTKKVKPGFDQEFTLPKGTSAAPIKQSKVKSKPKKSPPLEVKKGPRADKKDYYGSPVSEKGSPYQSVDELAAPLHRRQRYYTVGTEKKKLKEAGERISKWFRKKDKLDIRTQPKLPGLKKGGKA